MTPRATYRLQFHKGFGFIEAARVAPYLARLGVSHVYSSPWLKAEPGSSHGYNIVDHRVLNPELGSREDFDTMIVAFRTNGLGHILDFVPNHMGVGGAANLLWLDVLEWGEDSAYAGWFDIEWTSEREYLQGKLLVPFLADQYGVELYGGKLRLKFDPKEGSFAVWAYDTHKFPICPLDYGRVFGDAHPELERLADSFANLYDWKPQVSRRALELKSELAVLVRERDEVRNEFSAAFGRFQGAPGQPDTWRLLDALIQDQHWRAADFRVAADDINYRRFFNVNSLAGIRMELPEVFDYAHELVFQLIAEGAVDGLRLDHVDGLLDPKGYFDRLRSHIGLSEPFYLVVEKILARHESLRQDWPVDGTTGYEFTNQVLGLVMDPKGEDPFTKIYQDWVGERKSFPEIARESKLQIMRNEMASELDVLAREAARIARQTPRTTDFTHNVLRRAIREVIASFPVYRTYLDFDSLMTKEDHTSLERAVQRAKDNEIHLDATVFDFVQVLFSGDLLGQGRSGFSRSAVIRCAMKLQQFSGPVMAKGIEDTAFYRYNRFTALNEVGGDPDHFGLTITEFHEANSERARHWPRSMLTSSTHDTKRGEDSRARLAVLSEIPDEWCAQVDAWSRIHRASKREIGPTAPPDRNDEYSFYQLLVSSWPSELTASPQELDENVLRTYVERLKGTMTKCMREAKVHSTWRSPNKGYEDAVLSYVDNVLDINNQNEFFSAFLPFVDRIARLGVHNSLMGLTLKLTCPGVPDIYQGSELWDLSMVDPDNRREVDFDRRTRLLDDLQDLSSPRCLLDNWRDGRIKMFVVTKLLRLRAEIADVFESGVYEPFLIAGAKSDLICGFERRSHSRSVLVLTARYPARREADPGWSETKILIPAHLRAKSFRNVLTGAIVPEKHFQFDPGDVFLDLPVAVMTTDK
jgi:(1->4)-alpha-D-glucan 1-alpha-D-glucosylmutase